MAQAGGSALAMAMAAMLAVCALAAMSSGAEAAGTTFNVGEGNGWTLPATAGGYNYTTWAAKNSYKTGDKLFFRYGAGAHNVLSVTGANFNSCVFDSPLLNDNGVGNYTFNLDKEGNYWFVCSVNGGKHCEGGMKFKVSVAAATSGAASASLSRALPALLGALGLVAYFLA